MSDTTTVVAKEFEVLILQCDPGDEIELPIKNVPAVVVIVEGTGSLNDVITCEPGRCYYHPAAAAPLKFAVSAERRGPLKVAIAHKNLHLTLPTTFSRTPQGSMIGSTQHSPYPGSPRLVQISAEAMSSVSIGPADYVEVPKITGSWK